MGRPTNQERGAWHAMELAIALRQPQLFPHPAEYLAVVRPDEILASSVLVIDEHNALRASRAVGSES